MKPLPTLWASVLFISCTGGEETTVHNTDPEVVITYPSDGSEILAGEALTFLAQVTDGETDTEDLNLHWSSDVGGPLAGTTSFDGDIVSYVLAVGLETGQHTISLSAIDDQDAEGADQVTIYAVENQAPEITIKGPESGSSYSLGDLIEVEVLVTDDRDAPSDITLTWEGASDYTTSLPSSPDSNGSAGFFLQDLGSGSYALSVTATDSDGAYSSEQVWFGVVEDADGDGYEADSAGGEDCDDSDADVNPDAEEVCDGVDNDCDGAVDDEDNDVDTSTGEAWYADDDNDGYGDPEDTTEACEQPDGHVAYDSDEDCDDNEPDAYPGNDEICDGVDNDCDGTADNDDATDATTWYADSDGDDFGDDGDVQTACEAPANHAAEGGDCDDGDDAVNPDAAEVCDGVDNDCDGDTDEPDAADASDWYHDADGDGYGDADDSEVACDAPADHVADDSVTGGWDCDDTDDEVNPAATEVCNGDDDDCDGDTDDDDSDLEASTADTWHHDADGDGYGDPDDSELACEQPEDHVADESVTGGWDCDDSDDDIHPSADETCDDEDEDCDDSVDEDATDATAWYADDDSDGYGDPDDDQSACDAPTGHVGDDSDCDDTDDAVNPDATEICDGVDNDCDGTADNGGDGSDAAIDATSWYADGDSDGFGDADDSEDACDQPDGYADNDDDCDDGDGDVNPAATESCDSADEDCDGQIDEAALDASTWYADADGDGYGDTATTTSSCEQPSGYVSSTWASDCDDGNSAANPGETEVCNGVDDDCDGTADEPGASGSTAWYADDDADGYGDPGEVEYTCTQPAGYVDDATDCDDGDNAVNPDGTELCDGVDNDCDGADDEDDALDASEWYLDADSDGFGDPGQTDTACYQPASYTDDDSDCDDSDEDIFPGATEVCDGGTDEDCDGSVDEEGATAVYVDSDGDGFGDAYYADTCAVADGYSAIDGDCDDGEASINPDGTEICDGIEDEDCDGVVDEDVGVWYRDADSDGYGNASVTSESCDQPSGYVADDTDCDDGAPDTWPGADEYCDGVDTDCDGTLDDDDSIDASAWYLDADGDGYGDETGVTAACDQPSGYDATGGDCDDSDDAINPDATETCNGVDDDCDGVTDSAFNVPDDYSTIQSAITAASSGDTICVDEGTYTCPIDFGGKDLVIQGAGPGLSIVDGGAGTGSCVVFDDSETADAYFGGFTITNNGASSGSAFYIYYADPTIEDIAITEQNCTSFSNCGGLGFAINQGSPTITDVSITDCEVSTSTSGNAGGHALAISIGGRYSSPTLSNITISDNLTDLTAAGGNTYVYGGMISVSNDATPVFYGVEMINNTIQIDNGGTGLILGGLIYSAGDAEPVFYNLNARDITIDGGTIEGGMLHSNYGGMSLYNAIFANIEISTSDGIYGGVGYAQASSSGSWDPYIEITNSDIVGIDLNANGVYGGVIYTETNSGTYDSGRMDMVNTNVVDLTLNGAYSARGNIAYCSATHEENDWDYNNFYNVSGGTEDFYSTCDDPTGTNGNTSVDPLYVDTTASTAEYWDLTLDSSSPVANAGDPTIFDTDGSYSAIGAYGGPYGESW